jgi:hypothetical protein
MTDERRTTGNSTYKKLAVQWLNETLCLVSSSLLADSFVLRNRQLHVAAKRYGQVKSTLQTMTPGNDKKYGRTFFDLIAEHPKLTFFIFLSQLA